MNIQNDITGNIKTSKRRRAPKYKSIDSVLFALKARADGFVGVSLVVGENQDWLISRLKIINIDTPQNEIDPEDGVSDDGPSQRTRSNPSLRKNQEPNYGGEDPDFDNKFFG